MTGWQEILNLAQRLEPELRREFIAAIERLRTRVPAKVVADAIAGRSTIQLALPGLADDLEPSLDVLRRGFIQAATKAATRIAIGRGLAMRFDITNQFAIDAARDLSATFVTRISEATRAGIRSIVTQSVRDGLSYREAANLIRPMIGLTESQVSAVLRYRLGLLELGLTRERAIARVKQYAVRLLRERALTVARTELMFVSNAGQDAAWMQAIAKGHLPPDQLKEWLVTPDDRLCERCRRMSRQRVPVGVMFPQGGPPLHPRCRCTIVLVTPAAARRVAGRRSA